MKTAMTYSPTQKLFPHPGQPDRRATPLPSRMLQYLSERFPPVAYSIITLLFVVAGISLSSVLRLGQASISVTEAIVGFVVIFTLFFQLRVADEWKDRVEDALYQSDRPVPRGLVTLSELTWAAGIGAALQVALVTLYNPSMLILLAVVWTYFALMSREFFCPAYLRARPFLYVVSHMFILVLSDLFITALDWWHWPLSKDFNCPGLWLFLAAGFANGLVIELGRKIRAASEELPGVESYSKMLGLQNSCFLLLGCLLASHILLACSLSYLPTAIYAFVLLALTDMLLVMLACRLTHAGKIQKPLTNLSNLAVLIGYLVVFLCSVNAHIFH